MSDPAGHSACTVAALGDVALEGLRYTSVDRIEAALLAEPVDEAEQWGAWVRGEGPA